MPSCAARADQTRPTAKEMYTLTSAHTTVILERICLMKQPRQEINTRRFCTRAGYTHGPLESFGCVEDDDDDDDACCCCIDCPYGCVGAEAVEAAECEKGIVVVWWVSLSSPGGVKSMGRPAP